MARRIPAESNPWGVHPMPLSIFLLVAWIMASVAILTSLCASCYPKSSSKSNDSVGNKSHEEEDQEEEETVNDHEEEGDGPEEERITELDIAIHGPIRPTVEPAGSTSKRRLSVSMSIGLREGLSRMKTKKKEKKGGEESLWKKTIILGGKCKFQNDEDGIREEAGNISATTQSLSQSQPVSQSQSESQPVSRSTSSSSTDTMVMVNS